MDAEEFDKKSMVNLDGTLKTELAEYLDDPIFNKEIVYMPWFRNSKNKADDNRKNSSHTEFFRI